MGAEILSIETIEKLSRIDKAIKYIEKEATINKYVKIVLLDILKGNKK